MILSVLYMAAFLACGLMTVRSILPGHRPLNRIWLGLSLGVLEEMWFPAVFAFFFGFGITSHLLALALLAVVTLLCILLRDPKPARSWDDDEKQMLRRMLWVVLPLTILGGYLQYTHVMRVDGGGNWNVGQSTYGDLPMHLSFITGLKDKMFPADYPFYPGTRLSYPFLTDSLSTTFYLMGCSLQAATILPATLMMFLCFAGVMILGREMTAGKKTVILAALLFFLNGGLGFLYDFDLAGGTEYDGTLTLWRRIENILQGYYKTPTNQPDPNNLRWSNVIADLMVPQRTLLGGWCAVLPCFYLLETCFRPGKTEQTSGYRGTVLLGIWAGALPLIHTHSFLALGLYTAGIMIFDLIAGDPRDLPARRPRKRSAILKQYLIYGGITILLALPQLLCFTFTQTFQGEGSHSFLTFHFNWVNSTGGFAGMKDMYLWFYVKNIGIPFIFLLLAVFDPNRKNARILSGALMIILAAELIRFQPNDYDNNKLLYLAWMMCCMVIADWVAVIWGRLKGLRCRYVMAVLGAFVIFVSAGLTLWRECVSSYQAYSASAVEAGVWARDETEDDAVFLTGTQHLNPVLSIGGKTIVCGPDLWLYWHGFDTTERQEDIRRFMEDPAGNSDVIEKYGVDYIYISSYEYSSYEVDRETMAELYPCVFSNSEAEIYVIPNG